MSCGEKPQSGKPLGVSVAGRRGNVAAALPAAGRRGKLRTAQQLHAPLVERARRKLTLGYVYGLLHRQGWRKLDPRPEPNPVEHLWDHLRENYVGNRVFRSLQQ